MGFIVVSHISTYSVSVLHIKEHENFVFRRGQLGLGQLDNETIPTLIDGLAGVKVSQD